MKYCKHLVLLLLLLLICPTMQGQGQRVADSLAFQTLRDSMMQLRQDRKYQESIEVGEELLKQATDKEFFFFMIEANMQMARAMAYLTKRDDGRPLFKKALEIAIEQDMPKSQDAVATNLAINFFQGGFYDSAEYYFRMAVDLSREKIPSSLALNLSNLAWIYGVMDDREREFEAYLAALKALDENPESQRYVGVRAMTLGGLGDYYSFAGDYEKAKGYFEQKLALGKEVESVRMQYEAHAGLGHLYRNDEFYDFEKSKENYEVPAADEDPALGHYRHQALQGLAKLYRKEKLLEQSLAYFNKVYDYYKSIRVNDYSAAAAISLGEIYFDLERFEAANRWLTIGLKASEEIKLISRERYALASLYKIDSLQGRYRLALIRYQRLKQIEDSLSNERSRNRIKELEIQFETEQTEKENLTLKADLELSEAEVERQQIIQVFVAVVALVFIILAMVIYRNFIRKKRDNKTIASQADELKTLSRFKEGLTSMVVHDMRNPLNAILGFSQGTPTDDKLRNINRSGHQVLNLVNNMLDIQRFEEAKVDLSPETIEARSLVIETIREVSLIAASKSLKLINKVPAGLRYKADPVLAKRVLVNLLINSVKYSKSGTEIIVSVGEAADGLQELVVTDQGHGIAAEELPFIFDKFWHKDPGKSGVLPSTGLGLSFCKMAVEAHGGSIKAVSVLHQGTSIRFSLPLANEAVVAAEEQLVQNGKQAEVSLEDIEVYERYLPDLEKLKVFEVSEINKLIKKIDAQVGSKSFGSQLRSAAFQGDQALYEKLLNQIRQGATA